jgi:hypothetical protein
MLDLSKLSPEERQFVTEIINRLDAGDAKAVGAELLAEFRRGLTPDVMQRGYRLADVVCQADMARAFNEVLREENRSPLHFICVGFALAKEGTKNGG